MVVVHSNRVFAVIYHIAGNFRRVKFSFQVLKTSVRGIIFVLGLKCSIKKYMGP